MKAPKFWSRPGWSLGRTMLYPLSCLYRAAGAIRTVATNPKRIAGPVLCVGNATMGGAGKTPVVISLAKIAQDLGITTAVVSRGYGGRLHGPVKVDADHHTAIDVGDEPLLIAKSVETWVSRDRVAGASKAVAEGVDLIILDDGFQNPTLKKDISVLVVDGGYGFGNTSVFPAGPLREPVETALDKTEICILVGQDRHGLGDTILKNKEIQSGVICPDDDTKLDSEERYFAFAGIGLPEKFFQTLRTMDVHLVGTRAFPDHYRYKEIDLSRLAKEANKLDATLVTTRKDFVRLPDTFAEKVRVLDVSFQFADEDAARTIIERAVSVG